MSSNVCAHTVPKKRLHSIKALVVLVGATEWFWRSQIWEGHLPYLQMGKKMLVDARDIETFIENNKQNN